MKKIIREIDRALKQIYNLETPEGAEQFLLSKSPSNKSTPGALFVKQDDQSNEVSLGIYFDSQIQSSLRKLEKGFPASWNGQEMNAFSVASEEVSHFHYLLCRANKGEKVTQVELETQGEVDKFFLCYFAATTHNKERLSIFESLFERLFYKHTFSTELASDEKSRYADANQLARDFVQSTRPSISDKSATQTLNQLRAFYHLPRHEKLSLRVRK